MWLDNGLFQMCLLVVYRVWAKDVVNTNNNELVKNLAEMIKNITEINNGVFGLAKSDSKLKEIYSESTQKSYDENNIYRDNYFGRLESLGRKKRKRKRLNEVDKIKRDDNYSGIHKNVLPKREIAYQNMDIFSLMKQRNVIQRFLKNQRTLDKDLSSTLFKSPPQIRSINFKLTSNKKDKIINSLPLDSLQDFRNVVLIIFTNIKKTQDSQEDSITQESKLKAKGQPSLLREGCVYCIKSVIRKCYNALKSASNNICRIFSCKSGFKKLYKSNSKTGCLREFVNGTVGKSTNIRRYDNIKQKVYFIDTRGGYLDCGSDVSDRKKFLRNNAIHEALSKDGANLNILRDKYERACQRSSNKKCIKACSYAIEGTCKKYKCMKRKIKKFKKICKRECKMSFGIESSSRSSESSDSSDDDSTTDSD